MTKTPEQKRAKYAFKVVDKIKVKPFASEFSRLVAKIPSYILTNGLGNTIAFLFSKGKDHHLAVAGIIADWILKEWEIITDSNFKNLPNNWFYNIEEVKNKLGDIMEGLVVEPDISHYSVIIDELLSLFVWLKRFCDGIIEKKGN